ncbi:MAG: efflux RND transporter periplasmic adaptor subunit [Cyanobacteria bacterium]|nr:efflux RND transporter periplasmic adaptor subunit [Cyanobacteriota bacterium]MDA0867546.1 efflux RND transporter periplasmic adaptor subunit [Cyanobacteriota bacterium]
MEAASHNPRFSLPSRPLWLVIAALAVLGAGGSLLYWRLQPQAAESPDAAMVAPEITTVTALGSLEPAGEVIYLTAPTSSQESRIDQLLVAVGDAVEAGDVIAILDSRDRLQASYDQALQEVAVAQARLAQVRAGAKPGDINTQRAEIARLEADQQARIAAQQATVNRLQAEVQNAEVEAQRYDSLYGQGAISASERDTRQLTLQTTQQSLQQAQADLTRLQTTRSPEVNKAQATLSAIATVRSVDVQVLEAELGRAQAAADQAQASLEQAYVKSPQAGVIMDIHTRAGEVIASEGIVEIGQTEQMVAIAEVYESDVQKVQPGQSVRILSTALPGDLRGTVEWVGLKVEQQGAINTDPSQNIDAKVVEVRVRLDAQSSQVAANFTNLQVEVEIEL